MNRATPALLVCSRSAGNNVQKLAGMAPVSLSLDAVLNYDTFLFDADGVLWTGDHPVPGAIQFISTLLATGKRVFVITNNSTKTLDMYMTKLAKVGFGNVPKENVISPAMVLADFIRTAPGYKGKEIYLIGTENLRKTLEDAGVHCFGTGPDHMTEYGEQDIMHDIQLHGNPKAVVCSYDSHFSYPKLMKAANYLSRKDVDFLVTNEDYTFPGPIPGVVIPGSGATSACVRAVSGREPLVFGKPGRPLADFLKKNHRIKPETTIMFGDRLDTDIAFANVNRFASCLVLTGVHNLDDAAKAQEDGKTDLVPKFTFSICTTTQLREGEAPPKQQGWISKLLTGQQMDPSGWQKQSHSSLLSSSERIYEISTHNFAPGRLDEYLNSFENYKGELNQKVPEVELVGSWTVAIGRNRDQAIHLWRYTNGYKGVDNSIAKHRSDTSLVAVESDLARLCGRRKNVLVKPFSYWREPEQRAGDHVYDFRSYVLQPGSMIEWANAWAKGITFRREHNQDVGGFFSQVGQLYVVYHIWAYPSMCARNDTRTSTWAKPGWDATVAYTVPLIKKMQSKILTPTKFSQLQ